CLSNAHFHGIGMQLWELAQRNPTAASNWHPELQQVNLTVGRYFRGCSRPAINDDFDRALTTGNHRVAARAMERNRIAGPTPSLRRQGKSMSNQGRRFGREGHLRLDCNFAVRIETHLTETGRNAINFERHCMRKSIADIRPSA